MNLHVGDLVATPDGRLLGTVTHVTALTLTVCNGPSAFDLIHPQPSEVRKVA